MIKYIAALCACGLLTLALSGPSAYGQVVTVYSPPIVASQPAISSTVVGQPVIAPYTAFSPPVVAAPSVVAAPHVALSPPVVSSPYAAWSPPVAAVPVAPVYRSYSLPIAAPVAAPVIAPVAQPVVITPRAYIPGQPVRNVLRSIAP